MKSPQKNKSKRILFIGGKERGLELVKYFVDRRYNLVGVFCQREEEHEATKFSLQIEAEAKKVKVPFILARTVNKEEYLGRIALLKPDLVIVMGWPTLISEKILSIPRLGCVAVHESKLPAYRGFAPVSWQIINGEKTIWLSLFYINAGMDSGDIIAQTSLPVREDEYMGEIYKKTGQAGIDLLKKYLDLILTGKAPRRKQEERKATYSCPRTPADGEIDWNSPTKKIYNLIRAVSHPYPGAFSYYLGKKVCVWAAEMPKQQRYIGRIPGHVIKVWKGKGSEVLTGDGQLLITRVQAEGEQEVVADNIINSIKVRLGR